MVSSLVGTGFLTGNFTYKGESLVVRLLGPVLSLEEGLSVC